MKFIGLVVHSGKIRINQEIIDSVANLKKNESEETSKVYCLDTLIIIDSIFKILFKLRLYYLNAIIL